MKKETAPEGANGGRAAVVARALDVVARTVAFGLGSDEAATSISHLHKTCGRWLEIAISSVDGPTEKAAILDLKDLLSSWTDSLSLGAKRDLLKTLANGLDRLGCLALPEKPSSTESRCFIVPHESPPAVVAAKTAQSPHAGVPAGKSEVAAKAHGVQTSSRGKSTKKRRAVQKKARVALSAAPKVEPKAANDSNTSSDQAEGRQDGATAGPGASTSGVAAHSEAGSQQAKDGPPQAASSAGSPRKAKRVLATPGEKQTVARVSSGRAPQPPRKPPRPPPCVPRQLTDPEGPGISLERWGVPSSTLLGVLKAAGLHSVADLLLRAPVRFQLLPRAVTPSEPLADGSFEVVRARVGRRFTRINPLGRFFEVVLQDDLGKVTCRWMSPVDGAFRRRLKAGSRVAIHGRIEHDGETVLLHNGELVWVDSRGQGRQACYDIPGVADSEMRSLLRRALDEFSGNLLDPLPQNIQKSLRLLDLGEALRRLHFPTHSHKRGMERLAFDELLLYQLGVALRQTRAPRQKGTSRVLGHGTLGKLQVIHDVELNDEQEIAFSEIRRDLCSSSPMYRLLQGNVGAGKGLVALLTAVLVAGGREQVVFVTPDALVAEHRYLFAENVLRSVGMVPMLVEERPGPAQADAIRRGEAHVIFATPAFTRPWPTFRRLGLVVLEERGVYGTMGIEDLPGKAGRPDLLVMTAAPIPTSLALTVFSIMDLSMVNVPAWSGVRTEIFEWSRRTDAYEQVMTELRAGRQAYVVLPLIDGQERLDRNDLAKLKEALSSDAFPGMRVGVFSALMRREERQRVYDDFRHRRLDVLLTTTMVEDGPMVSTATSMIVEHADQFDLMRLHRLRAHVARGSRPGMFFLVQSTEPGEEGLHKIETIFSETEGFKIAELDLAERAPEALLGKKNWKIPVFKYVDPLEHRDLMVRARKEALSLLQSDANLSRPQHHHMKKLLEKNWRQWFPGKLGLSSTRRHRGSRGNRRRARSKKGSSA